MNHKKEFPQDNRVNEISANCWGWPDDDLVPIDLSTHDLSHYSKQGLSQVKAARRLPEDTPEYWKKRRQFPILYLVKYAEHALAERLYYRLARTLNLPQQHVFWGVYPAYPDLVAVAIRFETNAFFPSAVDPLAGTVTYRRRITPVENALDKLRHRVLHTFCGSADGNQVMVHGKLLFGIDAADCTPSPHNASFWHWFLDYYQTENPAYVPTLLQMMQTIAEHPELPDLVEQELLSAPYPALRTGVLTPYSERLRTTYAGLVEALRISKIK